MKYGLVLLIYCLLISCNSSEKYANEELEQILNERYGEEFIIGNNKFLFQINKFQFTALVKQNPKIKVHGSYLDNQSEIEENYLQMVHCYQGEEFLAESLERYYDQYAVDANITSPLQEKQKESLPPFPELARSNESGVIANFRIYLFDTLGNGDEAILNGIVAVASNINESYYNIYTFTVYFWDREFLKGRDLEKLKFGFNYNSDKYADNFPEKNKYIKEELTFEFDTSEKPEITIERLKALVAPYKKGKQYNRL